MTRLFSPLSMVRKSRRVSVRSLTTTRSVLGWRMTVARVVTALAGSALLGALVNRFEPWFEGRQLPRIAGGQPRAR